MNQAAFETKYASVKEKLEGAKDNYDFKTDEETWENVGTNPLDLAFIELSRLYLDANETQRNLIFADAAQEKYLHDIWYFVRRIAKLINSPDDTKWLEIGLAAAQIDGARGDFRDLITSLVLLSYAAEINDIDPFPFFDDAIESSNDELKTVLLNAKKHPDADIHFMIQTFGWRELINESKSRYGEHPSAVELQQRMGKARNINCSTLIIVFLLILTLIYFAFIR